MRLKRSSLYLTMNRLDTMNVTNGTVCRIIEVLEDCDKLKLGGHSCAHKKHAEEDQHHLSLNLIIYGDHG
ncbi:unnamed protein product [Allacma fusca]|uniref:Uncharacterized protein n=1 Tax=Allacma fusca TaxID=39272 RepID=A0A8J2LE65_9HEXA|nr:unnamed protein product [Allacma fusca]